MKRTALERLARAYKFGTGVYLDKGDVQEIFLQEPGPAQGWMETTLGYRLNQAADEAQFAREAEAAKR